MRLSSRRVCSPALTSSQYFSSRIPESAMAFSTAGASSRNRPVSSGVQKPITGSTPARLYQLRSKITTSPPAGKCWRYRWMYICDSSRWVGAGRATTRNTRGLTRSVIRLIVPPFPAVSRPSNTTQILAPDAFTHSCMATSSPCRTRISFSYSLRFIFFIGSPGFRRGSGPVQRFLEFLLVIVGQRGLQHGAAVPAHRLDGLVRGDLLHHQEQRRGARLEHATNLLLELLVDAGFGELTHQRAHPGPDGHPEDRDEEQQPEQESPEHPPGGAPADRMVVGVHVIAAVRVAVNDRDRVRLDDQILGQPARLVGGGRRRRLVRVTNGDQGCHDVSFLLGVDLCLAEGGYEYGLDGVQPFFGRRRVPGPAGRGPLSGGVRVDRHA